MTPSSGLLTTVSETVSLPVTVLVRPRPGDFLYSPAEWRVVLADVVAARRAGFAGVTVGALAPDGTLDRLRLNEVREAAGDLAVTFHRAFDVAADPLAALEALIECGVDRLLTSGQAPNVLEGRALLAQLVERAAGRLEIIAGGGVRPDTVGDLVSATRVPAVHLSATTWTESGMAHRREVAMGGARLPGEYELRATDAACVRACVRALGD